VVTAGIQASLLGWHTDKVIQDSAWDRLAQFEVLLQRVSVPEGERIVAARLEPVVAPLLALESVHRHVAEDPLFPLGRAWADEFLKDKIDLRPRSVLNAAREGWRREQEALREQGEEAWLAGWGTTRAPAKNGEPPQPTAAQIEAKIDESVERKLAEVKARRLQEPHTLPPDAGQLAGLVLALFKQCEHPYGGFDLVAADWARPARRATAPRFDLLVRQRPGRDGEEVRTRLLFVVTFSALSVTAALRRLLLDAEPPERAWLITDERQPPPLAAKGKEYYQQLFQRGEELFQHVKLSFEEIADLDALQSVVGLARAGDLEIETQPGQSRPVSETEVIASHQRRRRYRTAPLLRELARQRAPVSV
jgi:hypothetical protein